jgi:rRNA maturation endonuclease Nob1
MNNQQPSIKSETTHAKGIRKNDQKKAPSALSTQNYYITNVWKRNKINFSNMIQKNIFKKGNQKAEIK